MNPSLFGAASMLALSLTGCVAERHADSMIASADTGAKAAMPAPKYDRAKGDPAVSRVDAMYFGQSVFRKRRGEDLPPGMDHLLARSQGEVDLSGFAALVTKASRIPVALNIAKAGSAPATATPGPILGPPTAIVSRPAGATMAVLWDGSLTGLLDLGAARYGVDWEYRDGVIQIADERTETFVLHALPTTATMNSVLNTTTSSAGGGQSSGSSGGSGSSGSGSSAASAAGNDSTGSVTAGYKATLDVWTDIKTALGVIVGDRGRVAVTPSTGTITVTAVPTILNQVASYIRTQNAILTRQVFVRMRIYSVNIAEGDDAALTFNAAFTSSASKLGLTWASPGTASSDPVGVFKATVLSSSSTLSGSDAVAQALSSVTNTSLITELNLSALNNRPASKQDVRSESYIAQTSVTTQQLSTTTQIIPASLTTGFTASILPRIISENRVLISYSISLSSLVSLVSQTSGGSTVQLPTVDSSSGPQEVALNSGQILMLSGYVSDGALDRKEGTGVASNFLLGGTRSANTQKKRIVITMEPIITSEADQ